jgi:hypothetical protein
MTGFILLVIFVLLCSAGAYFIANTICQRRWKEKIPQSKLIGFTAVFVINFVALGFLMAMASTLAFGR